MMEDTHLCFPPYFSLGPAVLSPLFNSRIAARFTAPKSELTNYIAEDSTDGLNHHLKSGCRSV